MARSLFAAAGDAPAVLDPACGEGALLEAVLAISPDPARTARERLFGIELDPARAERARRRLARAAGLASPRELDRRIVAADALAPTCRWPPDTAILANPPWLSFSGRQASRPLHACPAGWPSLQSAFLVRIAAHVEASRQPARVLLPASVTELAGYAATRRETTARSALDGVPAELGEDAFPGVTEPGVLLALRPRARSGPGSTRPWTRIPSEDQPWISVLEELPKAPPGTFADPGLHSGNAAAALVHRPPRAGEPPLYEGRCLAAYALETPRASYDDRLRPVPGQRFHARPPRQYARFPVLVRQTANRPIAALHEAPGAFRNSLLAARPVPDLDPAFLVAVLNGPVAAAWHRTRHRDARQRAFPQVKVAHLASQPLPIARRCDDPELHDELAARARHLQARGPSWPGFEVERRALDELTLAAYGLSPEHARRIRSWAGEGPAGRN